MSGSLKCGRKDLISYLDKHRRTVEARRSHRKAGMMEDRKDNNRGQSAIVTMAIISTHHRCFYVHVLSSSCDDEFLDSSRNPHKTGWHHRLFGWVGR